MWKKTNVAIVLVGSLPFLGCPSYTLQKARISGPTSRTPIGVVDNKQPKDVEIVPTVVIPLDKVLRAEKPLRLLASPDPDFKWNLPAIDLGVQLESTFSGHFLGRFGVNYSGVEGQSLLGGQMGLGYYWNNRTWGWRLDATLFLQQTHYQVRLLRTETGEEDRIIAENGKDSNINPAAQLSINSSVERWPVNFIISFGGGTNTYSVFDAPEPDVDPIRFTASYNTLVLGAYRNLSQKTKVVAGFRSTFDNDLDHEEFRLNPNKEIFLNLIIKLR